MKRFAYRLLAASSVACLAFAAGAATRPRYGGTLHVEIQSKLSSLDSAETADATEAEAALMLRDLMYDRLVRLDAQGHPEPALAVSWEHDEQAAKWRFKLRPAVKWQNGSPLVPEEVVRALKGLGESVRWTGDVLEINGGHPLPDLLATLATDPALVVRQPGDAAGSVPIGTGPFRLTAWESGSRATLQANEDYWDGRPYVDSIELQLGRSSRDELLDLELGKADVVDLDPVEARRAQQDGRKVWSSAPVELLCLRFSSSRNAAQDRRIRQALADSIDRAAMQKVLLQNYGEVAGSIFPQWLSGYAFLFPATMNLDRARQLLVGTGVASVLRMSYDSGDLLARETAERVAVNARDAGLSLNLRPVSAARGGTKDLEADLGVQRVRIDGPTLGRAAREAAVSLGLAASGETGEPEQIYAAERQMVDALEVIPLIHIPELVAIGPRVANWSATPWGAWRFEQISLESEKP